MKLIILGGLLVVAATNIAGKDHGRQSECCRAPKYTVSLSSLTEPAEGANKPPTGSDPQAPTGDVTKPRPWKYAVRVGQFLYVTSVRSFESLDHHEQIINAGDPYHESLQIMNLTDQILKKAGCVWSNVHDVVVLVTGSTDNFKNVSAAMHDFCNIPKSHCYSMRHWITHFRTAQSFDNSATVEFAVQASGCKWTAEVVDRNQRPQPDCCSVPEPIVAFNIPTSLKIKPRLESLNPNFDSPFAIRIGEMLNLMSVHVPDDFVPNITSNQNITYQEAQWILNFINDILDDFGCTWNDVHDLAVLVTDGLAHYNDIDRALNDFCRDPEHNCSGFPWAAHLRSAPSIAGNATVEFTVQASNCEKAFDFSG